MRQRDDHNDHQDQADIQANKCFKSAQGKGAIKYESTIPLSQSAKCPAT